MNRNRLVRWLVFAILMISFSAAAYAQVFISVRIGPPALPVYAQPICPGPGYIWTPGYWSWDDDDGYYWVPGTWVVAPVGMYWTPGYWGWNEGFYVWHGGYWGPHVGFYGGINYGFGYTGVGFAGGYWQRDRFYYNRSVTNVNVTNVTNVYNKTVIVNNTTINRVSYNGGHGGVMARPSPQERAAERDHHREPVAEQMEHQRAASRNRELFARENHGRPAVAATVRPADFRHAVVPAKAAGAVYHPPAMSPREARGPANAGNRPMSPANSNNANPRSNRPFTPPNAADRSSKSNEGSRPFSPPSSKGSNRADRPSSPPARNNENQRQSNPMYKDNANSGHNPTYEPRGNARESAPPPRHDSRPQQESRPQHESRPAPGPRESAPRQSAPRHESGPPSPQRHESAPHRENAPKQEKDHNPGRGR
jgi:hypothetical protein